jgi:hypothetical protein
MAEYCAFSNNFELFQRFATFTCLGSSVFKNLSFLFSKVESLVILAVLSLGLYLINHDFNSTAQMLNETGWADKGRGQISESLFREYVSGMVSLVVVQSFVLSLCVYCTGHGHVHYKNSCGNVNTEATQNMQSYPRITIEK